MQITEVRVFPVGEDKLKAYASIVFDDCFIVNDLKVIQGKRGLFLSMPSRRRKRGGYRDVAHPLNNETRDRIEERVIAEYRRSVEGPAEEIERRELAAGSNGAIAGVGRPPYEAEPEAEPVDPVDPVAAVAAEAPDDGRPSLEEVEKEHLSDSFWSVS